MEYSGLTKFINVCRQLLGSILENIWVQIVEQRHIKNRNTRIVLIFAMFPPHIHFTCCQGNNNCYPINFCVYFYSICIFLNLKLSLTLHTHFESSLDNIFWTLDLSHRESRFTWTSIIMMCLCDIKIVI